MATGGDVGQIDKKDITDLVTCPLCLEPYQQPKLLLCGHSVCRTCLQLFIDKSSKGGAILCPVCRRSITLPKDGMAGWSDSFFIVRLQSEYSKRSAPDYDRKEAPEIKELQNKGLELATAAHHIAVTIRVVQTEKKHLANSIVDERDRLIKLVGRAADQALQQVDDCLSQEIKKLEIQLEKSREFNAQVTDLISDSKITLVSCSNAEDLSGYRHFKETVTKLTGMSATMPEKQALSLLFTNYNLNKHCSDSLQNHFRLRRRINPARKLQTIRTLRRITALALHLDTMYVCADGELYRLDSDNWTDISDVYNTEERAFDVCVDGDRVVVSKGNKQRQEVELAIGDVNASTLVTSVSFRLRSRIPYFACGKAVKEQPTYYVFEYDHGFSIQHIDNEGRTAQYGKGELELISGVALSPNGDVVVLADSPVDDVLIFSPEGEIKRRLFRDNKLRDGKKPKRHYFSDRLAYMCIDQDGLIFVSYSDNIFLFSVTGDYITKILTESRRPPRPQHLAVSLDKRLAVETKDQIELFTYVDVV